MADVHWFPRGGGGGMLPAGDGDRRASPVLGIKCRKPFAPGAWRAPTAETGLAQR